MDPEDWGELVASAIAIMGDVVDRYGGTVTEFAGDGIVALFGAPRAHEDDPYRAVRAGMGMVAALGQPSEGDRRGLDVRIGIHTGLVVAGDVAAGELSTYSALGDTLNVAARLQEEADPGSVVISAQTRRLLGSDVQARMLGPAELKGRKAPVVVYEVEGVRDAEDRRRGLPGLASPTVGRDRELELMRRLAAASSAGTGRVVAILGEPGVGKSRLVRELRERPLQSGDELWAVGTCVPFDDELPYHMAASLVRSIAGVGSSETTNVTGKAVEDLLERLGITDHVTPLKRLVGVEGDYPDNTAEELRHQYSTALLGLTSGLTGSNGLVVLVCEDAHWADASSADLISELVLRVPTLPILFLLVMRPDRDSSGWDLLEAARRNLAESLTEIRLDPLDSESSRSLISNLLEVESLPPNLRRLVLEKAEGNPFYLEEVVRMLIDSDLIENSAGRWVARSDVGELDVPETIQGLLASRIDVLDPQVRQAGRVAAVIGRRFSARLFDEVYDTRPENERGSLHPNLAGLEAHGMVRLEEIEPELEFGFRHALVHEVMYQGLLHRERRDIHHSVAAAMERMYPDRIDELAPALARHYAEAGANQQAVSYYLASGRTAQSRGARVEAARFFEHAEAVLEADPDADPRDLIDAITGKVKAGMGFIPAPAAIQSIQRVLPIAIELDDPDRLARLYERLLWTRSMQGETYSIPDYRSALDAGHALIPRLTDKGTAALLHAMMGGALRSGDQYAESIGPLSEAVTGLQAVGRLGEASYNAAMLADSLSQIGRFDEAKSAIKRARELGEQSGDPNSILDADIIQGSIAAERGDLAQALEYTQRGIEGAETHGNTFCNLAANFKLADQKLRLGEVDAAIIHLERSTGLAEYCDAGGYEVLGQAWLAMARSRSGDPRPGDFDAPLERAIEAGSRSIEGLVRLQRGITLAEGGELDRARPDFERAIELFADYGGVPNLARAHHSYGQALGAAGLGDEAGSHLQAAQEIFDEWGIQADR
jgi:tetratricopeptide (TPR) repeat protein